MVEGLGYVQGVCWNFLRYIYIYHLERIDGDRHSHESWWKSWPLTKNLPPWCGDRHRCFHHSLQVHSNKSLVFLETSHAADSYRGDGFCVPAPSWSPGPSVPIRLFGHNSMSCLEKIENKKICPKRKMEKLRSCSICFVWLIFFCGLLIFWLV